MPAPYSYDLRKKAIEAVKRGHKKLMSVVYSRLVVILWIYG